MPEYNRVNGCVFCTIISSKKDEHLAESPKVVVIKDKKPRTSHHYLVLSKVHINKATDLTPADIDLVREMERAGRDYLRDALKEKGEADIVEDMLKTGFHFPPALRVHHLHMHILYPVKDMSWFSKLIFGAGKIFKTTSDVLSDLQSKLKDGDVQPKVPEAPEGNVVEEGDAATKAH